MYMYSRFKHTRTHRACTHTHAYTTYTVTYQDNGTEEKVFKKRQFPRKRKVFVEDLKELTEVE